MIATTRTERAAGSKALALALMLSALLASLSLALVGPASAAFPGENGKIAFRSDRDGDAEVFVMNPNGSSQTKLTNNAVFDGTPNFSPDGKKIAFRSDRDRFGEIYVMNATDSNADGNGDNVKRLTNNAAFDNDPAFSPDGSKIAFVSNRDGGNFELYVMDAADANNDGNGDNQVRLTDDAALDREPAFSPDGSRIAFRSNRDGDDEIWVLDVADPSNPKRLTKNTGDAPVDFEPTWSPDGNKIAFTSNRDFGNFEVYLMDSTDGDNDGNGDNQTRLTASDASASDAHPAFSPDGDKIAFHSNRAGGSTTSPNDVYVMDAAPEGPTNQPQQLTDNGVFDGESDWQPVDATPPGSPIITSPADNSFDTDGNVTISGTAEGNSTVTIFERFSGGTEEQRGTVTADPSGGWSKDLSGVADGSHTYVARATDDANNTSGPSEVVTVIVDTAAPQTTISSGPDGPTNDDTPAFEFSSPDEANATFACRLTKQGGTPEPFASCDSGDSFSLTDGDGDYNFEVRARDGAGNEDGSPAQRTFTLDKTVPTVGVSPAEDAPKVRRNTAAAATFSEPMKNDDSLTISLERINKKDGTTTPVEGTVSYDEANRRLEFDPSAAKLAKKTKYTATARGEDLAGNPAEKTWSFTTGKK